MSDDKQKITIGDLKQYLLIGDGAAVGLVAASDGKKVEAEVVQMNAPKDVLKNFWDSHQAFYQNLVNDIAKAFGMPEIAEKLLFDLPTFSANNALDVLRSFEENFEIDDDTMELINTRLRLMIISEVLSTFSNYILSVQQQT